MEFLQNHWGDLFSVLGLVVTGGGLAWAIWEAHRARQAAEEAADAAVRGAREASDSIARTLTAADLQKAIDLIERLKDRHATNRWSAAVERYPDLRAVLFDIEARLPETDIQRREVLTNVAAQMMELENQVNDSLISGNDPDNASELTTKLNRVQSSLQKLASRLNWDSGQGSG